MTQKILHFTIGPVQDFIADARRLRDYWVGSFLLSLLSGHAMLAAKKGGVEIVFPEVGGDYLFEAIENDNAYSDVYVGSLPNRFKALVSDKDENIGATCSSAVLSAWNAITDSIWTEYLEDAAKSGRGTKDIWDRQVKNFWDIAWAVGEEPIDDQHSDGSWLDMRKNWRRLRPELVEDGDHCRLMGQYQELSGYHRIGEVEKQRKFWNDVIKAVGGQRVTKSAKAKNDNTARTINIGADEHLCALAFIKRVFPIYLREYGSISGAISWQPGGDEINTRNWPSTSYIAALPWLQEIKNSSEKRAKAIENYEEVVGEMPTGYKYGETATQLFGLADKPFFKLDGHLLHDIGIDAYAKEHQIPAATKEKLHKTYQTLFKDSGETITKPSAFYAILRMDGDGIGSMLKEHQCVIKQGLANFTTKVKDYFSPDKGNSALGTLVYAGGDDVLAVLPVDTAIKAARALRSIYTQAFKDAGADKDALAKFTLSGSIVYTHFKNPLSAALRLSEHMLDDVAKEKNGRNSLSLCIEKPGGIASEWVSTFGDTATPENDAALQIDHLSKSGLTADSNATISGGFFHSFAQKYRTFGGETGVSDDVLAALVKFELKHQSRIKKLAPTELEKTTKRVLQVLRPQMRKREGSDGPYTTTAAEGIAFGGGLIVRFLAQQMRPVKRADTGNSIAVNDGNSGEAA